MVKWSSSLFYRRVLTFAFLIIMLSVIFGAIYYGIYKSGNDNFSLDDNAQPDFFDFLYFSWITQSTIGYGDMSPNDTGSKWVVCIQSFLFWMIALTFAVLGDENDMLCIIVPWKKCNGQVGYK